jgi:hypothetical protein
MQAAMTLEASWKRPTNVQESENAEYQILTENAPSETMLNFPNQSRVFDPTRHAVRFWGHDSAMEWSFCVTEGA